MKYLGVSLIIITIILFSSSAIAVEKEFTNSIQEIKNTTFRGNPERTGVYPNNGLKKPANNKLWEFRMDGYVHYSPAISGGLVYFAKEEGHLYALDVNNGKKIFKLETVDSVCDSPAISDGVVYFHGGYECYLYAVDARTGREKWTFKATKAMGTAPAVYGGVVYFGSFDGYLYAVDAKTGQEKWTFKVGHKILSSPVISNGIIYFDNENYLFAVK